MIEFAWPRFVRLGGAWINPAQVVAVGETDEADRALGIGRTAVDLSNGRTLHLEDLSETEVLAMLTGGQG